MTVVDRPGGRPDRPIPVARHVARAIAGTRLADGTLRPEDDTAAAAALEVLDALGLLLTVPQWHQVRSHLLHQLADSDLSGMELWDSERIRVQTWLRGLAITEERCARTGLTPPSSSQPSSAAA